MDLSRGQKLLIIVGLLALLAGIVVLSLSRFATHPPAVVYEAPAKTAASTPQYLKVDVAGAVVRPGVYTLASGSRVEDAIALAGGLTSQAAAESVNRAARLEDGQQITVASTPPPAVEPKAPPPPMPASAPAAAPVAKAPAPAALTYPLSLNRATLAQLDALPGVGPVLSQNIVYYRQQHGGFRSVEELANVPGIGAHRMGVLRPYLTP